MFSDVSGKIPGNVLVLVQEHYGEFSWIIPAYFPRICLEMFRYFFPENFRDISRKISGTFPGNVPGFFPEIFRDPPKTALSERWPRTLMKIPVGLFQNLFVVLVELLRHCLTTG